MSNSRYDNLNNENIIFLTPNQVNELDIGLDLTIFNEEELNNPFPFLVDTLKEMVTETTLGGQNGDEVTFPVENSRVKIYAVININGKQCKVQTEELVNGYVDLPHQIKLFQRLLLAGDITLEDLAAEDIDNNVYKKLVVNDIEGATLFHNKMSQINQWETEQNSDPKVVQRKLNTIKKTVGGTL